MKKAYRSIGSIALGWLIGSCGDAIGPLPPTTDIVIMSAATASLVPNASIQLSATARDRSGKALLRNFAWSSSDPAKATVSSSGMVAGVAPGTAIITAAVDGKSATAAITVLEGGVVSSSGATLDLQSGIVQIVVPADALATNTNLSVVASNAFATDARVVKGTAFDFGPSGTNFAKSVSLRIKYDPANLPPGTEEAALQIHLSASSGWQAAEGSTVDISARVVTAQVSHFSTYAILTPAAVAGVAIRGPPDKPVVDGVSFVIAGESVQLTATLTDSQGGILSNRVVTWATSSAAIASVTPDGLVAAVGPGSATISASAGGVTSSITATVTPVPVSTVAVTLSPQAISVGQTSQAAAVLKDLSGNVLAGRPVGWVSDNPGVAAVNPATGVVTAITPGSAIITATSEGLSGSATLTVAPMPVATVTVSPATASVVLGSTAQLSAETRDASNNVLPGRTVIWSSSDESVATADASGLVTTRTAGLATITAMSEGKTGTSSLTVTPVPVASVSVSLASPSVVVSQTTQATAVTRDASGNVLAGRDVAWNSNNTAVATVSSVGLVTAAAPGTAGITATSEGKTATSSITVTPIPVATVIVSPATASVTVGSTEQLLAETRDASSAVLTGRSVSWSSSNTAIAAVDASGLVTAVSAGNATITATSEEKSGTSLITVTPVRVASVSVTLEASSLTVGQTTPASAVTLDANNNVLSERALTWTSDNSLVATVSITGMVTALTVGTAHIIATSEGISGSAVVTVTPVPVASVSVSLAATSVQLGQTTQATATTYDGSGNLLGDRAVTWSSDNEAVATASATGLVTSVSVGTATITAASEGKSGASMITVTPVPVASVSVTLATSSVVVGQTTDATATLRDAAGGLLTGGAITWSSENTTVAAVSSTGVVTTFAVGSAVITATSDGVSGSATITVTPIPVASVSVALLPSSITAVETAQATATTFDASGGVLTGRTIFWTSDNTAVATVDSEGLVTAVALGIAQITATSEGTNGSAIITVIQAPVATVSVTLAASSINAVETTAATATLHDSKGRVLTGRAITWSSDNTGVATVSSAGAVTAASAGTANITATSEAQSGSATLTVTQAPVATVTVSPDAVSVVEGATQQLSAETRDASNNVLTGRLVSWSSSNTEVATVSSSGLVTAVSVGNATITATSEGKSATSAITVIPVPVASVSVSLTSSSVEVGQATQATAITHDANGNVLAGREVAWSSDNELVATVSSAGLVTTLAPGTATITATSEGVSGSSMIAVTPIPVASVNVTLAASSLVVGQTTNATAITRNANGSVLTGRTVTWSSDNTAVATVSIDGVVTAVGVGSAQITATSESISGIATLTITPVPVATVTVSLASSSITAGETTQATATTLDANGNVLAGRAVAWSSNNTAVAAVSTTGLITSVSSGTAQITAASEGQSGSATITVIPIAVATVTVSLETASLVEGSTLQLSAETRDASDNVLTGRVVDWSSSNTAIATVAATGLLTAVSPGTATITATSEGKSGGGTITVTQVPVASVIVSPAAASVVAGGTEQLSAETRDASNNVLTGRTVIWSSSDETVATVDANGLVMAQSVGSATIVGMSEGKSGTSSITVTPVPVATVTVSLAATPITAVETSQATATTLDANGGVLTGRSVEWSSNNTAVATVASSGLVTGVAVGTAQITATSEEKTGTATITVTQAPVATVSVSPATPSLLAGASQQLAATLLDAHDNVLTGRSITWTSSAPSVATIDENGLAIAVSAGNTTITATSEGQSGSTVLTVTPIPVASVTLTLAVSSLVAGETTQATATARDAVGNELTDRMVTFASDNPDVATVSQAGLLTAVAPGSATITATSEGKSGSALLTVLPVPVASVSVNLTSSSIVEGQTTQATATTRDANDNVLTGRIITWSSGNTALAIVSSEGVVTAIAPGTVEITATSEGVSGGATVTVTPVPVASVSISPATASVVQGSTQQLTVETRDAGNNVLTGRTVTWSSSDESVVTIDVNGLVTAHAVGSTTITATSEGVSGSSMITVTLIPVASVNVTLAASSLVVGQTTNATAITRDANGSVLTGRTITWSSDNTAVATVSIDGVVTAVGVGSAQITATSESISGSATLTITPVPVALVSVSLAATSVEVGQTTQATAATHDANGNVLTGREVVWSSDNESVATVSSAGLISAHTVGTATITGTSEGQSSSATITVTPIPVASVTVNPETANLLEGSTLQLSAEAKDANNNVLTGRAVVWSSANELVATVSPTGLVSAITPGSTTITATSEGKSGAATITVTPVPVATVTVSLASSSITAGETTQATATTLDANGNALIGRVVEWSSDNTTVATVGITGLVTSVSPGTVQISVTSEGKSATAPLTVTPVPVASVGVSLGASSLIVGQTTDAAATTLDADGAVLTGRLVAWSSDNEAVATVSPAGLVTAVGAGAAQITATSEGKSGSATITVTPVPVASVSVTLALSSVMVGETILATATTQDADNNVLTGRIVTWSSDNTAVATVSSDGVVTAIGSGGAQITAASEGQSGSATITVIPIPVATVTVSPETASLVEGSTLQLSAQTRDASNNVITGRTVTWSSSDEAVAAISSTGLVTAVNVGSVTVTATSEGVTGSATITVTPRPVASVTVALVPTSITAVGTAQATATTLDASGGVLTGRTIFWTSDNTAVSTVDSEGLVTAVAVGTAQITATSEEKTGSATITVTQAPVATVSVTLAASSINAVETTQATATLHDSQGRVLTGRAITWSSDNTGVATVSSAGAVIAVSAGTASITATSEAQSGSAALTVTQAPVATVTVSPDAVSVVEGATQQLSAETRDASNNVLTGRLVNWSSSNTEVATVSSSGLVTAISVGSATITVTSEGKSATSSITVTPIPVASVSVSLAATSVQLGQTTQATATTYDGSGNVLSGRPVTWSSDNEAVATISATGLVTTVSVGTAMIAAASEGHSGSTAVTVTPVPVATVIVSPATASVVAGATEQLSAETRDAGNNVLTGRTVIWSSSDESVATVDPNGLVTAQSVGSATITATSEGRSGTSSVTVTPVPVATVAVALNPSSITAVETSQATATTLDASGGVLTGRPIVWTSDNTAVATVSSEGLITAVAVGTAQITATSEEKAGSATITVTQAPVATVSVSPVTSSVMAGASQQLTATLFDAHDNVLTGRSITWTSSVPSVATVDENGLVTAVSVGNATITATSEGKSATSAITVIPVPVASVSVSLTAALVEAGQATQATAVTHDASGNVLTGREVAWSSDNGLVATVSTTGLVTTLAPGTATITATSEGVSGSSIITVTPIPVASVAVTLAAGSLVVGQTTGATAITRDASGGVLTGRTVTWLSDNAAVGTVSSDGVVTAVGVGSAQITATSEGISGSATLTVTPVPVGSVTVSPGSSSIMMGTTTQMSAVTYDANGNILSGRAVIWNASAPAVATVSADGVVTAVAPGTTEIIATSEGTTGSATITVTPIPVATVTVSPSTVSIIEGITEQLSVTLKDANDNVLTGRALSWQSDHTEVATVSSTGLVTAVSVGTATITATSEGVIGSATITVIPIPVASVTVALVPPSIAAVETSQATATTLDASGGVLTGRTITWSSDNTAVATVSSGGLITALAVGTAQITATSEEKTGSATITVTQAPVATVSVALAASSINAVETTQASATLHDSKDRVLTGRVITWSSDNTAVATVSSEGLVTAVAVGTAQITATSEEQTGSAAVTVTPAPVATVTVSPASASVAEGSSEQLTATLKDAQNRVLSDRPVTWSSSNMGVATASSTGLVTAVWPGSATITATSEGVSGTSSITVPAPTTTATLLRRSTQNPRYFENSAGQVVYLTGSHTWSTLSDNGTVDPPPVFNYTAYLDFLTSRNHNFFRLWTWEQEKWTTEFASDYWFSPGPYQRSGPGSALDGKPRFDLTQFNQAYFDRLRQRVIAAGSRGIYVSVMLFDGWSVATKGGFAANNPWKGHPFNAANNINGIDGDTDGDGLGLESHTLTNSAVTARQEAYVRKVIDAVGDLDNVLYEISNESDPSSKDWQNYMIQFIRSYEATRPKQHPIGMTPMWPDGADADLLASSADWISITGTLANPITADGSKVLISDTDHLCGVCGNVEWVWKSLTKGHNPILMDLYDGAAIGLGAAGYNASDPIWEAIRKNLGYARSYALRMDLAGAVPHGDVVLSEATGYSLAKPGAQYLVFVPGGGSVTLDLSAVTGSLNVEWFNPTTGVATQAGTVTGGPSRTLTAPFSGPAVLFLH